VSRPTVNNWPRFGHPGTNQHPVRRRNNKQECQHGNIPEYPRKNPHYSGETSPHPSLAIRDQTALKDAYYQRIVGGKPPAANIASRFHAYTNDLVYDDPLKGQLNEMLARPHASVIFCFIIVCASTVDGEVISIGQPKLSAYLNSARLFSKLPSCPITSLPSIISLYLA